MPSREVFQYIAEKSGEKIEEFLICRWCSEEYPVFHKEQTFVQKQGFVVSDLCFDCRLRSMFLWRNERKLYWRKSDKSGKKILSMFHPEYSGKVYDYDEWDKEEGFGYMGKPVEGDILTSYYELLGEIPKSGTDIFWNNENIWYCNRVGHLKNAYYSFVCFQNNEDIYFSYVSTGSRDIYNSSNTYGSQLIAESVRVFDSYGVFFSDEIVNSKYIWFSYDLRDCEECIFCHNQVGKKYMVQNTQYPKEQYESMKAELQKQMSTYTGRKELEKRYELLQKQSIKKALNQINAEKAYGDGLQDSKDVIYGFGLQGSETTINSHMGFPGPAKDVYSSYGFGEIERIYYSMGCGPGTNGYFLINTEGTNDAYYSQKTKNCNHGAFCFGLLNQDYSILNMQYSKEEYAKQLSEIREDLQARGLWGKMLDPTYAPFPLNDTNIPEEFPVAKVIYIDTPDTDTVAFSELPGRVVYENPEGKGRVYVLESEKFISQAIWDLGGSEQIPITWRTREKEVDIPEGIDVMLASDIPNMLNPKDTDILSKAIMCEKTGRAYRIIKKELDFYTTHSIALPRIHPDVRISERRARNPKIGLYLIDCSHCHEKIISVYSGMNQEKIYCQKCYDTTVY